MVVNPQKKEKNYIFVTSGISGILHDKTSSKNLHLQISFLLQGKRTASQLIFILGRSALKQYLIITLILIFIRYLSMKLWNAVMEYFSQCGLEIEMESSIPS